jgi:tyrosine-protein phosphatase SIW14
MLADGLYRGGQPDAKGFEFLKKQGFKTIINLRAEKDEADTVKQLGMNYVQIPIDNLKPWSKIPESAITKYFAVVNDPANYPIFFHCRRGADRTGALAAFYRIGAQGWDAKKAHSEARNIGMRWWFTTVKQQVYDFKPVMARTNASIPAEAR